MVIGRIKILTTIFCIIAVLSCNKDDTTTAIVENISVLIHPSQTDVGYSPSDKSHYVVRNTEIHLNKLLLFIGGSFSTPENYSLICDHGATIGLDVISLSYPNNVPAATLASHSDLLAFDKYRDEICFGNSVSDQVNVDVLNSINMRTIKLLEYLATEYPNQNWDQYLTPSNTLEWSKIIVSGHSQGSGHACYLAKKNSVDKVAMFSGPNDYSTFHSAPANWLIQNGQTPLSRQFALLHTQDQIISFDAQVANLRGLGLLLASESPTLVDDLSPPYSEAQVLSLNIFALSNHSSTIGSNAILPDIWTYMFTAE